MLVAVAVLVVVTTGMALLVGGSNDDTALDQDICLLNAHGDGHVTLLLDFQKPVRQPGYANLLRDITLELSAGNELRVFSLTLSAAVPSQFLGRLCKPYDPTALSIDTAKDKHGATRDCDDLRAQITPALREAASDFCRRRDWLQGRINAVGTHTQPAGPVANAHLIQALDDTLQELAQRPGRQRLYVLSDMVQHAASYSHLDLPWSAWRFEDLVPSRPVHGRPLHRARLSNLNVNVLYLPRSGLTDARRTKQARQAFWREYFAGAEVTFSEQSPQPGFEAVPLMQTPKTAESAVRERKLLQSQRREAEDQLGRAARETEAIESQRQEGVRLAQQRHAPEAEPLDMAAGVEIAAGGKNAPEAGGEGALGRFSVESASQAACLLTLRPHFSGQIAPGRHPGNNRRAYYGDATITVSYLVDTQGATVDDDVLVLTGRSVAEKSEYFDILSEDTLRVVKGWAFTLQRRGTDGMCITPQRRTVTFTYRRKCIGRPMPSCYMVQSAVSFLDTAG